MTAEGPGRKSRHFLVYVTFDANDRILRRGRAHGLAAAVAPWWQKWMPLSVLLAAIGVGTGARREVRRWPRD
jgi:hypothetical protein